MGLGSSHFADGFVRVFEGCQTLAFE